MKKFLRKNKRYLELILIAVIAFNFIFLPLIASAQLNQAQQRGLDNQLNTGLGWISGSVLLFISSAISAIFGAIFGIFISLEAKIIDYILSPANFPLTNSLIVQIGWRATRDIANMFFILILLIIAFATVLKIQSYATKQLLWKVVVAALLINFSLVIAGLVVDFTQVLTLFFLNRITGNGSLGTLTSRLASSMQILNFYKPAPSGSVGEDAAAFGGAAFAALFGIVLTLVGLTITAFVFGAAVIFLIVRILYLWFLLIFAPIVWMLWIIPATKKFFSQWWDNFIKWSFFAPIYTFMMYLSLSIFQTNGQLNPGVLPQGNAAWTTPAAGLTTAGMPAAIFQWILVIAMMFGSLIVAQKFGVEGANGARKMLTNWGIGARDWSGRQLRRTALGLGAKEATETEEAKAGWLVRGAEKLAGTAIPGRRLVAGQVFKMTAGEAKSVEEAKKHFTPWTSNAIQAYLKNAPGTISDELFRYQQMGAALALKDQGKLDELDMTRIKEIASLASRQYPKQLDEILKVAPHLAPEFNKKIEAVVPKIDKPNELAVDSLGYAQVAMNLNPSQLKTIVQKANSKKITMLKNTVDIEFNNLSKDIQDKINKKIIGERGKDEQGNEIKAPSKEERNKALRELAEDNPYAERVARAKFTTKSPAWDIS